MNIIYILSVFIGYVTLITSSSDIFPWFDQIIRQEVLTSQCDALKLRKNVSATVFNQLDHILVETNHKLMYCYVPKVACTNWKRILYVLSGKSNKTVLSEIPASLVHENGSLTKINQLNTTDIVKILTNNNNYIKLLVVRHPFERLLSAYRNKLEGTFPSAKYFQARVGRYIIRNYRKNPSNSSLKTGADVSFREFVQYLIKEGLNTTHSEIINEHWRPIHQMCHPCMFDYTFIIKYEFLIEEAEILLDLINARTVEFPMTKVSKTNLWLKKYFQQLSLDEIQRLYELYKIDFMLFGYDLQNILGYDIG